MVGRTPTVVNPLIHVTNARYKTDANYSIEWNRWLLIPLGVWPIYSERSVTDKLLRRMLNLLCHAATTFAALSMILYILVDANDLDTQLRTVGPLCYALMAIMKYVALMANEQLIKRCVRHMEHDWRNVQHQEDRSIMMDSATFARRIIAVSVVFMFGGVFFYQVVMPLTSDKIVTGNATFRPLAFPVSQIIIDVQRSPVNEMFIPMECMCAFVMSSVAVGACSLAAVCAIHACGQLRILMSWLRYLVDGRPGNECDNVDVRFAKIVRMHVRILSFVSLTDDLLRRIALIEVLGCTINICFLGYYVVMMKWRRRKEKALVRSLLQDWNDEKGVNLVTYVTLIMSFVFNIFIFCYIGELLTEQCKKVAEETYMIDWYRLRRKESVGLLLINIRSLTSNRLTAGNFVDLSLSSFGDVMKTSIAYLNMLRTVTA